MVDAKIKETYVVAISSSLWGQNKLHTLEDGLVDQMPSKAIDHMCELNEKVGITHSLTNWQLHIKRYWNF